MNTREAPYLHILKILNRYSIIYILLAIFTVFMFTTWLIQPIANEEEYQKLLTISAFIILFICGLILLIFTLKFNIHARAKKAWLIIAAAIFMWAIGEFSYIVNEFVLMTEDPIISDLFRFMGYPIFLLGLVMQWRLIEIQIKKIEAILFLMFFGLCLMAIFLMLNIELFFLESLKLEELFSTAAYPTLDLVLTFISGTILWKIKRNKMVFPWIILTLLLLNNMILNWQLVTVI